MTELNVQEVEVVSGGLSDRLREFLEEYARRPHFPIDRNPWIL